MSDHKIEVPKDVADSIANRWPNLFPEWNARVLEELAQLCARYRGVPVGTFGARYGLVVEVATDTGSLVMRSSPDPDGMNQARVSLSLSHLGKSPRLHEVISSDTGTWTVMDRIHPGGTLDGQPVSLDALASLLRPMLNQASPGSGMPSLADWLRQRLLDDDLTDLAPGRRLATLEQRHSAIAKIDRLADRSMDGLCHGDASPKNILKGERATLFLIDPRGVRGEVAYDVAIAAWKTSEHGKPEPRAVELARLVGVEPDRVRAWLCVADAARV